MKRNLHTPYGLHSIDEGDVNAVIDVLRSDFLTTGPAVSRFEAALRAAVDSPEAVAVSSGTAALHLAALALGLTPGEQVVVPTMTFLATANAFVFENAEVVFADVSPDTGLMGVTELQEALSRAPRARAVVPVHLNGQTSPPDALAAVAREHGLWIVEDACHALGASYLDAAGIRHKVGACAHSDMACFSFHPVKTIAMGEGGAVLGRDPEQMRQVRTMRSHGMERDPGRLTELHGHEPPPWYYEMHAPGYNYRASDLHCALGESQLRKLSRFLQHRTRLVAAYDECIAPLRPYVVPIGRSARCEPAWHLYVVQIDFAACKTTRAQVMRALAARGIGTQVHYIPVHLQPYYRHRYPDLNLQGAEDYYARCLSLPLHVGLSPDDVAACVAALVDCLGLDGYEHE